LSLALYSALVLMSVAMSLLGSKLFATIRPAVLVPHPGSATVWTGGKLLSAVRANNSVVILRLGVKT